MSGTIVKTVPAATLTVYVKGSKSALETVSQLGYGEPTAAGKKGVWAFTFTTRATESAISRQLKAVEGIEQVDKDGQPIKVEKKAARSPMPGGKSVHADEPKKEVNWTPRRVAIVKAMRKLSADGEENARTAGEISLVARKDKSAPELADEADYGSHGPKGVYLVKVALDVYRTSELLHNGYAASTRHAGERELRYYLTETGLTTEFPGAADLKKAAAAKAKGEAKEDKPEGESKGKEAGKSDKPEGKKGESKGKGKGKGKPAKKEDKPEGEKPVVDEPAADKVS